MSALFYGVITFFAAFSVHLILWRIWLPRRNRAAVLANIFFWTLVIGIIVLKDFRGCLDYIVLYCSLAAAYIVSYPAMEADSPSLAIVYDIAKAGKSGLDKNGIYKIMTDDTLVVARVTDLLNDSLIRLDSGRYVLTLKGRILAAVFAWFRRLLNAPKGG